MKLFSSTLAGDNAQNAIYVKKFMLESTTKYMKAPWQVSLN